MLLLCHTKKILYFKGAADPGPLALVVFPPYLPQCSLSLRYEGCVVNVLVEVGCPKVSCSQHLTNCEFV